MRLRVCATDNDDTIAKDGVLAPAVRTSIANDCSIYQLKLERLENEGGSCCSSREPTSTMRDA